MFRFCHNGARKIKKKVITTDFKLNVISFVESHGNRKAAKEYSVDEKSTTVERQENCTAKDAQNTKSIERCMP